MSSTLVERLRESVRACRAIDRSQLLEEAAAEIERLRNNAAAYTIGISAGGEPKTLTGAEREAINVAERDYADNDMDAGCYHIAATLRGLLERTK